MRAEEVTVTTTTVASPAPLPVKRLHSQFPCCGRKYRGQTDSGGRTVNCGKCHGVYVVRERPAVKGMEGYDVRVLEWERTG